MRVRDLMVLSVPLFLTACWPVEKEPYADWKLGQVTTGGPDVHAAIQIGDPQVIRRETLINDRLREVRHLERLIDESQNATFKPQIYRDLAVAEAMVAQLGLSVNPAAGREFERQEALNQKQFEIDLLKLQTELDELKRLADADPSSAGLKPTKPSDLKTDNLSAPDLAKINGDIDKLILKTERLLISVGNEDGIDGLKLRSRQSGISQSPEERARDLAAYRAMLRQMQQEASLDDSHDLRGNT